LAELIELHDQERLAAVVQGSDVRGILGGHFHFTSFSTFAGVPVSVASATCYTSEIAPDQRLLSGVDANQAFTMLHLYEDRVVHSVVPALDGPEVTGHGLDMLEPFNALTPAERFDMVSRKDSLLNKPPA
ncbi:phosphodiesterase, partial [Nocardioides sp. GCM10030258]